MIVREKRADIVGTEEERRKSGRGKNWYGCRHRVLRWKRGDEDGAM